VRNLTVATAAACADDGALRTRVHHTTPNRSISTRDFTAGLAAALTAGLAAAIAAAVAAPDGEKPKAGRRRLLLFWRPTRPTRDPIPLGT